MKSAGVTLVTIYKPSNASPGISHARDLCHALLLVELSIIQFPEDTVTAAEPREAIALRRLLLLGPALSGGCEGALLKRGSACCGLGHTCVRADAPAAADLVPVLALQEPAGFPLKQGDCQAGLGPCAVLCPLLLNLKPPFLFHS